MCLYAAITHKPFKLLSPFYVLPLFIFSLKKKQTTTNKIINLSDSLEDMIKELHLAGKIETGLHALGVTNFQQLDTALDEQRVSVEGLVGKGVDAAAANEFCKAVKLSKVCGGKDKKKKGKRILFCVFVWHFYAQTHCLSLSISVFFCQFCVCVAVPLSLCVCAPLSAVYLLVSVLSLSLSLSLSLACHLSVFSLCLSVFLSVCVPVCMFVCVCESCHARFCLNFAPIRFYRNSMDTI